MIQIAELLFAMSLSGTLAFLVYLIAAHFLDSCFSANVKYICLKICMLFYLLPLPFFKHLLFLSVTPYTTGLNSDTKTITLYPREAIIRTQDGFRFPFLTSHVKIFLVIWGLILIVFSCYGLWRFWRFYRHFHKIPIHNPQYLNLLFKLKTDMHISSQIHLYECNTAVSPFTYGCLHPVIFLTELVDDTSITLTLRHELQHIKNHDFFYRILAAILLFIHCFNPFAYLFFRELMEVQEMNCDEHILAQLSDSDRKKYGHMIIDFASQLQNIDSKAICFSKKDSRFLKKRIQKITFHGKPKRILTFFYVLFICLVGSIPVAAYAPYTVEDSLLGGADINCDWIEYDFFPDDEEEIPEDEIAFRNSDTYIITEDGDIISIFDTVSLQINCQHTYTAVTQKKHTKTANGCIVKTFRVSYCTKCHFINEKNKTLLKTQTNSPCPH